jgi:hypothetical protein
MIWKKSKRGEFDFKIRIELGLGLTGLDGLRQKPYPKSGREAGFGRVRVKKPG